MILAAFPGPRWLVQFANVMILLHVLTAWQVRCASCSMLRSLPAC